MSPRPIRLAILNDYEVVVEGLRQMLEPYADRVVVVDVSVEAEVDSHVDVALYDAFGVATREQEWSSLVGAGWAAERVVLYTWQHPDDLPVGEAERWPLRVSKTLDGKDLLAALEQIHGSGTAPEDDEGRDVDPGRSERSWPGKEAGLTERESEVLVLIASGLSNNEIAERLFYSINTIKTRIRGLYRKIGAGRRSQAILWAVAHGVGPRSPG